MHLPYHATHEQAISEPFNLVIGYRIDSMLLPYHATHLQVISDVFKRVIG